MWQTFEVRSGRKSSKSRDSRHVCENLQTDLEGRNSIKLRLVLSILMLLSPCLGVDHASVAVF